MIGINSPDKRKGQRKVGILYSVIVYEKANLRPVNYLRRSIMKDYDIQDDRVVVKENYRTGLESPWKIDKVSHRNVVIWTIQDVHRV